MFRDCDVFKFSVLCLQIYTINLKDVTPRRKNFLRLIRTFLRQKAAAHVMYRIPYGKEADDENSYKNDEDIEIMHTDWIGRDNVTAGIAHLDKTELLLQKAENKSKDNAKNSSDG